MQFLSTQRVAISGNCAFLRFPPPHARVNGNSPEHVMNRVALYLLMLVIACALVQGAPTARPELTADGEGRVPEVVVKKDVVYGNVHGAGLLADIAYTDGTKALPVILSVHGGRWVGSHRADPGEGAIDVKQWAGFGFFAMSIDYRLPGRSPPDRGERGV